jgi:hypothetical protein
MYSQSIAVASRPIVARVTIYPLIIIVVGSSRQPLFYAPERRVQKCYSVVYKRLFEYWLQRVRPS